MLGRSGHSVENLALDLRTVIEELDLRGAVLVGHSMGGVAVMEFVREGDQLYEALRFAIESALRSVVGVQDVQREDTEP